MRLNLLHNRPRPIIDISSADFISIARGWLASVAIVFVVSLALRKFA